MSVLMHFPDILGSSFKKAAIFRRFFFLGGGFSVTDAGLLSESESSKTVPEIAKKIWNSSSKRVGETGREREREREGGSREGSAAVRGEEGGQETDDQACLPVLPSCTKSSSFVCFPLSSSPSSPPPSRSPFCYTQAFLSGATAAYPSQNCGAILRAFYPNTVPRLIEPRTEVVKEVHRGGRLNHHRGVDRSPSPSCALHIPPVVAVGIPLFGVVSLRKHRF